MNPIPDEWSVDVQGPNIIVAFVPGDETGRRFLTRHQARVLREQLRLADLLVGRNVWTGRDVWAVGSSSEGSRTESDTLSALIRDRMDLLRVDMSEQERGDLWARHRQRVKRYVEQLELEAAHPETATSFDDWENPEAVPHAPEGGTEADIDAGRVGGELVVDLPRGWSIEPGDQHIRFVVPASGVDGVFDLSDTEALAVGVRLVQLSESTGLVRLALEGLGQVPVRRPTTGSKWLDRVLRAMADVDRRDTRADLGGETTDNDVAHEGDVE